MFFHLSASSFACGVGLVWAVILSCLFFGGLFVHPVSTYQQSKGLLPLRSAGCPIMDSASALVSTSQGFWLGGGAIGKTFPCAKQMEVPARMSPTTAQRISK